MDENNLLRDAFSPAVVDYIALRIADNFPGFDSKGFRSDVMDGFDALSFGNRARKITDGLRRHLPPSFQTAVRILVESLGPVQVEEELTGFEGFYVMPFTMYVSAYGIDYPELSLEALYEMTKRFTAEGDIRPFIERHPRETIAFLTRLTDDPNPFARRLASEGTRPRLPLAGRLKAFQRDPAPVVKLLDRLYTDSSLMVRRSVANNLNDISKDNPEIAIATLLRWRSENSSPELDWLIRHALRTLIKTNDQAALKLLGYKTTGIEVDAWDISTDTVTLGESLRFCCRIRSVSEVSQKLALNYVIHFMKANGKPRPKVFRLPDKTITRGAVLEIEKVHKFIDFRNQSFYPGAHRIGLTINGESYCDTAFELVK